VIYLSTLNSLLYFCERRERRNRYNGIIEQRRDNKMATFTIKSDAAVKEWALTTEAGIEIFSNHFRHTVHAPLHYLLCVR